MENIDIIAILLTVIAIFVAIWIFRRVLIVVAIIIILAVIAYLFLQNNYQGQGQGLPVKRNSADLIEQFKDNYCSYLYDRDDSLMCEYIVTPIYNDIVNNYNLDSVRHLNKVQLTNLIIHVATEHKSEIVGNLRKRNALYLWKNFVQDVKEQYIF